MIMFKTYGTYVKWDDLKNTACRESALVFVSNWASGDFVEYCSRLLATGAGFAMFVGLPVSWYGSVGVGWEPTQRILGAVCSGILVVTLAVVRMYLGWAYVGNRLLSATVECMYTSLSTITNTTISTFDSI